MRKILISLVLTILPSLVAAQTPEVVPVPRADCANWPDEIPQNIGFLPPGITPGYSSDVVIAPNGSQRLKPVCRPTGGAPYSAVSAAVYTHDAVDKYFVTKQAFDSRLDELTKNLQAALDNSVVKAAIQDDQTALVSDEVWRRLHLKMAAALKALEKESQTLKVEIETMRKTLDGMRAATTKAGH